MDVPGRMIRVLNESFDVGQAEMEHARFMVIDPYDGMIVLLAHGISPFLTICGTYLARARSLWVEAAALARGGQRRIFIGS
jgi:hypothetical protein